MNLFGSLVLERFGKNETIGFSTIKSYLYISCLIKLSYSFFLGSSLKRSFSPTPTISGGVILYLVWTFICNPLAFCATHLFGFGFANIVQTLVGLL